MIAQQIKPPINQSTVRHQLIVDRELKSSVSVQSAWIGGRSERNYLEWKRRRTERLGQIASEFLLR